MKHPIPEGCSFIPDLLIVLLWEPRLENWDSFHCVPGNSFHAQMNIIFYRRGKKGDFPHNKFHCFHAVVMCKGRALCGRDILLYGKDIKSCCRSLSSLVPGLKLCEAVSQQRCLVLGFSL